MRIDTIHQIKKKRPHLLQKIWRYKLMYLLFIPVALNFILFHYLPMFGLEIAFKDYLPGLAVSKAPWVGLMHFIDFFDSYYFMDITMNTLKLCGLLMLYTFPAPIFLALVISEIRWSKFRRVVQSISYVPYFISSVIIVGILTMMLNPTDGVINLLLTKLGIKSISFLQDSAWFRTIYVSMIIWQSTGFGAIVYLSAIVGVDPQLYEAAIIDGAGRFARIWHITIKSILPTLVIMLILRIGSALNVGWYEVLLLQNNLNSDVSEIIQTFVYKRGIVESNYSYGTAVGFIMSMISLVLMVISNSIAKKLTDKEISLF